MERFDVEIDLNDIVIKNYNGKYPAQIINMSQRSRRKEILKWTM